MILIRTFKGHQHFIMSLTSKTLVETLLILKEYQEL